MKKYFLIFILCFSFEHLNAKELNFTTYIELSKKNDPDFKKILVEQKKISQLLDQNLPSRKMTLTLNNENGYNADSSQNTSIFSGKIAKEVIETGTALSVSHTKTIRPDRHENVTQVRIEQSLYKNALGRDVELKKSSLSEQEKLNVLEIEEQYENYFASILKRYILLGRYYREYKLSETIYREALRLQKNVSARRKDKIATRTDLSKTKLLVVLKEEDLLEKKNTFIVQQESIERTINSKFESFNGDDLNDLILQLEKSYKKIDYNSKFRILEIAKIQENILSKEALLKERAMRPELNLVVGYNKDESNRFATNINRNETVVGLNLEIPIGDTQSKANYEVARIELLKSQILARKEKLDYETKLTGLENSLKKVQGQLIIDKSKIELIKGIISEEEKRYAIGKLDLKALIDLKNDYHAYQMKYEESKLEYGNILIDYLNYYDHLKWFTL